MVAPEEWSAASGVNGVARSVGAAVSSLLATMMFSRPAWMAVPFFLVGGVKIAYDQLLWRQFHAVRPPEETNSL